MARTHPDTESRSVGGSPRARRRSPTATANFGSSRREAHDSSAFYERFTAPELSTDETINAAGELDVVHCADARDMHHVADDSIALVVTSPPYFAGKQYEEDLSASGVPADYLEYLELLRAVFAECKRVLEPGGRIAVNVANLGRRPYRSLSSDVVRILEDLGLLMRGEVIWCKGRAAGGSCAWGTFQRPSNPVLRDVTERILIAGKGRFDRALPPAERARRGLPSTVTVSKEEFMEATTDLWEIAPESATRVGHPAPFPVELPRRLIDLYTYEGDVVLDPFMGSGSTAVASVQTGRHHIGYDTDESYVALARERVQAARSLREEPDTRLRSLRPRIPAGPRPDPGDQPGAEAVQETAIRAGVQLRDFAELLLTECGFSDVEAGRRPPGIPLAVDLVATDAAGRRWLFEVSGAFSSGSSGLRRSETLWRALGRASVIHEALVADLVADKASDHAGLVLLTTGVPARGSVGAKSLAAVTGPGRPVHDVVDVLSSADQARLVDLAQARDAAQ
ncbi:MAG: site-specific DNA-methyltransferase [Microthrixaceae bacterium]|nr:site-specific DNA-methyltransferase [Microthrixaceae bacterium]